MAHLKGDRDCITIGLPPLPEGAVQWQVYAVTRRAKVIAHKRTWRQRLMRRPTLYEYHEDHHHVLMGIAPALDRKATQP